MSLIKWKWQHYPGRKCCLSFLRQCLVQGGQLRPVCRALLRTDGVCRCLCWGPGVLPDSTGAWRTWGPGCVPCELRDEHRPLHSAQLLQKASPAPTGSTEVGVGSSSSSLQEVEDEKVCSPSAFVFCLLVAISSLALAGGRMVFSALEGDQYSQHMGVCDLARCPCSHSGGKGFGRSGGTKPTSHLPLPHHTCACLREMTGGSA